MRRGLHAEVWPAQAALDQAGWRVVEHTPAGASLTTPLYTFDNLLPELLADVADPQAREPLDDLAGAILVQRLLTQGDQELYAGLAKGWRFPRRLWRLLLEVKAAGLDAAGVRRAFGRPGRRVLALAALLEQYQAELVRLGLADQADRLSLLEAELAAGRRPALMEGWAALTAREVLWLRSLDLRLLRAISTVVDVKVEFSLNPGISSPLHIAGLIEATIKYLEADERERVGAVFADPADQGGPLASLALAHLHRAPGAQVDSGPALELWRPAGRYAEAEALVRRALELVEAGEPAHDIALIFADLAVYGPMAADAAQRVGLPLAHGQRPSLADQPLAQAVLNLLALPNTAFARAELAEAWASPYLRQALAEVLGVPAPPTPARLLGLAGYIDAHETNVTAWLERAAARAGGRARDLRALAQACGALTAWLAQAGLGRPMPLADYARRVQALLERLDLGRRLMRQDAPASPEVAARDCMAWQGLTMAVDSMANAAAQAGEGGAMSPGRLLALLREALRDAAWQSGHGVSTGVKLLALSQAHGLRVRHLLVGGLTQEGFPARPQGDNLLSGQERLALGRAAGLPVWRTEQEEYAGQVIRLTWLLATVRASAVLSAPAAGANGGEAQPALVITDLAQKLGREQPRPGNDGGVYGQLPPLERARQPRALWGGLARALLRPAHAEARLAQAALWAMTSNDAQAADYWRSLTHRACTEQERARHDLLSAEARQNQAGPFTGRLTNPEALALLGRIMAQPRRRRLSPSQLEALAACPLAWFADKLLGLTPEEEPAWAVSPSAEGQWVHEALRLFFAPEEFDPAWTEAQRKARLSDCLAQALARAQGLGGHALAWQARQRAVAMALGRAVEAEWAALEGLRPMAVEQPLGGEAGQGLELAVDEGEPVVLTGTLDRLDAGAGVLQITDYKHSRNEARLRASLKRDDWAVTAFQLPVYLAAGRRLFGQGGEELTARIAPTMKVALAQKLKPERLTADDPLLSEDPAQRAAQAQAGQPNLFNAVADLWARVTGGRFAPQPEDSVCDNCGLAGFCRAQALAGVGQG